MITVTQEQDKIVEKLWGQFEDVLTDENNTIILYDFHIWKAGTEIGDIWSWFNTNHSKGIIYLFNKYE